jgi:hypothetical protein
MRFVKVGCGCTYLIVQEFADISKSTACLIEYCGDSEGVHISPPRALGQDVLPHNMTEDKVKEFSPVKSMELLGQLSKLISDGYEGRDLKHTLKRFLEL